MSKETHDLIIVGTGPAGLSAAIYAARYKIDFVLIGGILGGTMTQAFDVENYPGIDSATGQEISDRMLAQLEKFGHQPTQGDIRSIEKTEQGFLLRGSDQEYETKTVLLAMGMKHNKLGIDGEEEFCGKGVSYCATCDGFFFRNKKVAVIGGGNAAVTSAIYLSDIAEKVYIIVRRNEMRAEPAWQEKARENNKIEIVLESNVTKISGEETVKKITLDKESREIDVDGVFIEIGQVPQTVLFAGLGIGIDDQGYVVVDNAQKTNIQGVWAAGDLTTNSNKTRQIITAASEGAVAAVDIFTHLKKN